MIGDGMGFEQVKAASIYLGGSEGSLCFESFPAKGEVMTRSADSEITDSAAAATAMAAGVRVNNRVISIRLPGDGKALKTILELFKEKGKLTGLLTNSYLNDATPAAFAAHARKRDDFEEIDKDMLESVHPNLLFGGGCNGISVKILKDADYAVATDTKSMYELSKGSGKYWAGLFGSSVLPYEKDGDFSRLPHLSQMVGKALELLDNEKGFFIMIEGGLIDKVGHLNNTEANIAETVEFHNAVKVVVDWAGNRGDTLVIVTADHETGNLLVGKNNGKGNPPEVTWKSRGHTDKDIPFYAWGENSETFHGKIDNTDFFRIITSWDSLSR